MIDPPLRPAFVLGGAGFVGSHLVDRLLAEGRSVDVVDDLSTGSLANLSGARGQSVGELKFHHLDARRTELADLMVRRGVSTVYLLAALAPRLGAGAGVERLVAAVELATNAVEAALAAGATKLVVLVPAGSLYGRAGAQQQPVKEPPGGAPASIDGVAARAVVDLLGVVRDQRQLEFTVLAAGGVYGPRQRRDGGVVAALLAGRDDGSPCAPGDGRQRLDFVYVDDAVDALVRAGSRGSGLVINVGSGTSTTIRVVADLLGVSTTPFPSTGPWPPGEPERLALSSVRARIHLGWSAWTPLADGLQSLIGGSSD